MLLWLPAWSTFGLSDSLVQKAATWLLIGPEKRQHITSVLAQLHWLAVESGFIYILFLKLFMDQLSCMLQIE